MRSCLFFAALALACGLQRKAWPRAAATKSGGGSTSVSSPLGMSKYSSLDHIHHVEYPDDDYAHILGINDPAHVPSKLQAISALRLKEVAQSKQPIDTQGCGFDASFFVSAEDLEAEIKEFDKRHGGPLDLGRRIASTWPEMAIAAEFKKASPSKGDINPGADAVEQCLQYARVGAAVISVLTEFVHFKGTLTELKRVRLATQQEALASGRARPAILRKDFILDRYQVLEARAHGADTLLLIVAVLGVAQLRDLMAFSRGLGMEPLVEVHTAREMEIALDCGARVIGVNNRNLHTFQLDLGTTQRAIDIVSARGKTWRPVAPQGGSPQPDVCVAALSGITSAADVASFRDSGVGCVLVGETLMKSADPQATIADLLSGGRLDQPSSGGGATAGASHAATAPLVKTCGLTRADDASAAIRAGASLLGVIFARSPRTASAEQARAIVEVARRYGERSNAVTFSAELAAMRVALQGQGQAQGQWYARGMDLLRRTTIRTPLVVGVFQDQSAQEINDIVRATGIDLVQLHGDEPASLADQIQAPVIKVLHVAPGGAASAPAAAEAAAHLRATAQAFEGKALALLLDSRVPGSAGGGTGAAFDWSLASSLGAPVLLAGGLHKDNVAQAAAVPGVAGVDVSSGVESSPGVKDEALVASFIRGARGR